jgi:hypothetical protein
MLTPAILVGYADPASYGFWYSDDWKTVESVSATASANLYNEKSSKPHLNQQRPEKAT